VNKNLLYIAFAGFAIAIYCLYKLGAESKSTKVAVDDHMAKMRAAKESKNTKNENDGTQAQNAAE
jgi:hypothetical protein